MHTRNFIVSVLILFGCTQLFGQELRKEVCVNFRVGKALLDTAYADNAGRLSEIISFLQEIKNDTTLELVEVNFCGSASPEGSLGLNRRLAEERRGNLEYYVRRRVRIPGSVVRRCDQIFAWETLTLLVEQSDMPHKEEAVDVLRNVPETTYDSRGALTDSRRKHLMELQYGRTWRYMEKHFFPQMRNASLISVTVQPKPAPTPQPAVETAVPAQTDTAAVVQPVETAAQPDGPERSFYMALKTNMAYDVLAVPNIGVEFYLGKNWSLAGNWMYGWWSSDTKHRYWRIYGGEIAVRKWLGKQAAEKPLTGHHLGLYGQIFTYDFEWKGTGYMGGKPGGTLWESPNWAVGLEYGYSLPIGRRLNLDFAVGIGYWGGEYFTYEPLDGHYVWKSTKDRHWFGPTKAEISLVWLLGRGNTNDRKGGTK